MFQSSVPPPAPLHVGLIMDGNGRWGMRHATNRTAGHYAAPLYLADILTTAITLGVRYVTLYTFSAENWRRPADEINGMFQVMRDYLVTGTPTLHTLGVRLRHIGDLAGVNDELQARARHAIDLTRNNDRIHLTIAFNYSARNDILQAVQRIVADQHTLDAVDEALVADYLSTRDLPPTDLIIRTSGEQRLSNFLLWEAAYSLCWTTPTLWPDFRGDHLRQAVRYYQTVTHATAPPQLLEAALHR